MKNGTSQESNMILFKCTRCGFEDPMPDWLADEVLPKRRFGLKKVFVNCCIKCNGDMLPKEFLENHK